MPKTIQSLLMIGTSIPSIGNLPSFFLVNSMVTSCSNYPLSRSPTCWYNKKILQNWADIIMAMMNLKFNVCHVYNSTFQSLLSIIMCDIQSKEIKCQSCVWYFVIEHMNHRDVAQPHFHGLIANFTQRNQKAMCMPLKVKCKQSMKDINRTNNSHYEQDQTHQSCPVVFIPHTQTNQLAIELL